jgi:hypothetical protein
MATESNNMLSIPMRTLAALGYVFLFNSSHRSIKLMLKEREFPKCNSGNQQMNKQSTHWMYRRTVRVGALFIITVVLLSMTHRLLILRAPKELKEEFDHCPSLLGPVGGSDQGSTIGSGDDNEQSLAKIMVPSELMAMLEGGETPPRRIIHQSWKNDKLPDRFQRWSRVWRSLHGPTWV